MVGISRQTLHNWLTQEAFKAEVEKFMEANIGLLEEILLEGERTAAITLVDLLSSPDDELKFKAATRLLDMRGQRGKPVDKSEVKSLELKGDLNEALRHALRDPSVRKYLNDISVPPLLSAGSLEPEAVAERPGEPDYEVLVGPAANTEANPDSRGEEAGPHSV